jgi:hypothetical protein
VARRINMNNELRTTERYEYTTIEMPIGQVLAKYRYSKRQGEFSESRVQELRENITAELTTPMGPVTVDANGNIRQGNHRCKAAELEIAEGNLDPSFFVKVNVFDAATAAIDVASCSLHANFNTATGRKREQTINNTVLPLARDVLQPISQAVSSLKKSFANELTAKLCGIVQSNPEFVESASSSRRLYLSGEMLYNAKGSQGARALDVTRYKPSTNVRNQPRFTESLSFGASTLSQFLAAAAQEAAARGVEEATMVGKTRTTLYYVLFAACLDGRLRKDNFLKVARNWIKRRGAIRSYVASFTISSGVKETNILEALGLPEPTLHESLVKTAMKAVA